jgi:hypothetical protein
VTAAEILALVPAVVGAYIAWLLVRQPRRRPNRLAEAEPAAVPASVREELDRTPTWWVRQFHELLRAADAPSAVGERIDTITWGGDVIATWEDRGFYDCPCPRCRRICHA